MTDSTQAADALVHLGESLLSIDGVDESIETILRETIRMLGVDSASVALHDEDARELVFFASEGEAALQEFRVPSGAGIAGWTLRMREPVLCNDPASDHRFNHAVDRESGYVTHALLSVPLLHDGAAIGVTQALRTRSGRPFRAADLALLERIARLTAVQVARSLRSGAERSVTAALKEDVDSRYALVGGASPAMAEPVALARRVAETRSTVLLLGESGVGKEVFARAIHAWSPRRDKPFVAVNCVALSPQLLESELFGHERGAFTGATAAKPGRFELAHGGTLFLDEIGDLAPDLQTKLLRVLQEREVQRVGATRSTRVDVRIIAATNRDLAAAMRDGTFREDLYYRLNVIAVHLPPLRQRREDIPALVEHFVARSSADLGRRPLAVGPAALAALTRYDWPGNVRELANAVERAVVLCRGGELGLDDLPRELRGAQGTPAGRAPGDGAGEGALPFAELPLAEALEAYKRALVFQALDEAAGNQARAARRLGVAPSNLSRLLKTLRDRG